MHSSFRRASEHSDTSLIDSFVEVRKSLELDKKMSKFFTKFSKKAEESGGDGDDFVLVDDDETPDSETCTWEECIACIKVSLKIRQNTTKYCRIVIS